MSTTVSPDPIAWETTYRRYAAALQRRLERGLAYKSRRGVVRHVWAPSESEAEDLCHQAFCELYNQWSQGRYDTSRPVWPYLSRIASNLTMRQLAKNNREYPTAEPMPTRGTSSTPSPFEDLAHSECRRRMGEFSQRLTSRERKVLQSYDATPRSQAQVAREVGLSRDQVYRTLVSVRKRAAKFFSTEELSFS